jgi:hypothetical protein
LGEFEGTLSKSINSATTSVAPFVGQTIYGRAHVKFEAIEDVSSRQQVSLWRVFNSKWTLIRWLSTIRWQIDFPHQGAPGCKLPNDRSAVACSIANQSPVDGHVQVSEIEFFAPQAVACSSFINDKAEHCCCLAACVAKQKNRFGGNQL